MEKKSILMINSKNERVRVHILETAHPYFDEIISGERTVEVRKIDRYYQVGDYLLIREFLPKKKEFGRFVVKRISHIMSSPDYEGIKEGFMIMSIHNVSLEDYEKVMEYIHSEEL